ncbi:fluoride efflux transporter FluC [Serinicoccus kebangsaanensis]|uniref:fluoride efflux transporter FluC n=1 Tax=Serinicoccus kebangsaanensis TaxID=2602069 RepID=UPI00124D6539|nr:CrcB family protein [Serinicoccus kebangsaanensis]
MPVLLAVACVAVGGALGALLRHVASLPPLGPLRGTLVVNVVGALALGVLVGLGGRLPTWAFLLLGTGACGALTTWSTLAVHTWQLGRRSRRRAAAYLGLSLLLGVLAAALGVGAASVLL